MQVKLMFHKIALLNMLQAEGLVRSLSGTIQYIRFIHQETQQLAQTNCSIDKDRG